jgi:arylsulfatase A-like enzyme
VLLPAVLGAACGRAAQPVRLELDRESDLAEWCTGTGACAVVEPPLRVHPRGSQTWTFETRVRLRGAVPEATTASLHVDTLTSAALGARAQLGARTVGDIRLEPGRRTYPALLPAAAFGDAMLTLAVDRPPEAGPEAPFVLRHVSLDPAASPARAHEAPAPGVLRQRGGSAVRFSLVLPRAARLVFRAAAAPWTQRAVHARVRTEADGSAARELWSADLGPGSEAARDVVLRFEDAEGEPVRLSFHVDGSDDDAVDWIAPRLVGSGPPAWPTAYTAEEEGGAEALRARLAGLNVVVVLLDAASALHVGAYGYPRMTTPEIDRLAREGVLFERAYTPAPFTVAAVSSLWTSQYPDQNHYGDRHDAALSPERPCLAEALLRRGVRTAAFVANPSAGPELGLARGFSEFHALYRQGSIPRAEEFRASLSSFLADAKQGGPFFAYVHYLEPHFPYDPPNPFDVVFGPDAPLPRSRRRDDGWLQRLNGGAERLSHEEQAHLVRLYDGNLAYADREVGWIRRTLEEHGLLERTVLVVTADHGEALGERGFVTHGGLLDEASLRVPLVLRFPRGAAPAGLRVSSLVDLLDVAPTVADVFGIRRGEVPPSFEGRSVLPVVAGAAGKRAVLGRTMQERPAYALVHERWKLVHTTRLGASRLYDLASDPAERNDVSARLPVRTAAMRAELVRWLRDMRRLAAASARQTVSPETAEMLRALGYAR